MLLVLHLAALVERRKQLQPQFTGPHQIQEPAAVLLRSIPTAIKTFPISVIPGKMSFSWNSLLPSENLVALFVDPPHGIINCFCTLLPLIKFNKMFFLWWQPNLVSSQTFSSFGAILPSRGWFSWMLVCFPEWWGNFPGCGAICRNCWNPCYENLKGTFRLQCHPCPEIRFNKGTSSPILVFFPMLGRSFLDVGSSSQSKNKKLIRTMNLKCFPWIRPC